MWPLAIAVCHDRFFYCAFVPNIIIIKKNIDPAHFSLFSKQKNGGAFPKQ
jgi:hypothetical protein